MQINVPNSIIKIIEILMILEFLYVVIFAALFIKGFHAITRHGKLLAFLGFDEAKEQEELDKIREDRDAEVYATEERTNKLLEENEDYPEKREEIQRRAEEEITGIVQYYKHRSEKARRNYPTIVKPWSECETCMSSIWGSVVMILYYTDLLFWEWQDVPILLFAFGLVSLAGAITVLGTRKE